METLPYAQFSATIHRKMANSRTPGYGEIELTRRCPLSCVHCYNNLPLPHRAAGRELSLDEHRRILDEIAEAGCLWLLYTGGEVFARDDFLPIYTYAKQSGFLITLFTNGTLITPQIADHLAEWPPFSIETTLYGLTPEVHDRITRTPRSHERSLRGIRLLADRNLPLKLKTMALTLNKHELAGLRRFAEEELGFAFRLDAMVSCRLDCSRGPLEVRLTPEEVVELDLQDPKRVEAWSELADRQRGRSPSAETRDGLYDCSGGLNAFSISPTGSLRICGLSRRESFDVRKGGFLEGWNTFLLRERERKISRRTKCFDCGIKPVCGMCPANAELENADPEEPVDFLCRVAHLRARVLGIPLPAHGDCEYCPGGANHTHLVRSAERLMTRAGTDRSSSTSGTAPSKQRALPRIQSLRSADDRLLVSLLVDLLNQGLNVRFRARGWSMHPTIRDGEAITVEPIAVSEVGRGDIVLCRLDEGVVAHRVVRAGAPDGTDRTVILRGDAPRGGHEPVPAEDLLGRVILVERGSRRIDLHTRQSKAAQLLRRGVSRVKARLIKPLSNSKKNV